MWATASPDKILTKAKQCFRGPYSTKSTNLNTPQILYSGTPITELRLSSKTQYLDVKNPDIECLVIKSRVQILSVRISSVRISSVRISSVRLSSVRISSVRILNVQISNDTYTMLWYPDFLSLDIECPNIRCPVQANQAFRCFDIRISAYHVSDVPSG